MIFAGILAGGSGSRMESAIIPKQFIEVSGIPIFIRCLRRFLSVGKIDKVIVSINSSWEEKYIALMEEFDIDLTRVILVKGGESRFESLINIVQEAHLIENSPETIIITHDCARLFVTEKIIEDNLTQIQKYDMVTTSLPVIDTILYSEDGESSSKVPNRANLWADQGPQTFGVSQFMEYVRKVKKDELGNYIEAGKLYLENGCKIGIVKGDRLNFKVTNDIDLEYAEFLLERGYVK